MSGLRLTLDVNPADGAPGESWRINAAGDGVENFTPGGGTQFRRDDLTAAGGEDTITLAETPVTGSLEVYLAPSGSGTAGLLLSTAYSGSGTTYTLTTAATAGDVYVVRYATEAAAPGASTLTNAGQTFRNAVLALSPTGYWRLGDAAGTTMADDSGNGHTGTYVGSPTLGVAGATSDGDTAVSFASGKYATVAAAAAFNAASPGITALCFFKSATLANNQMLITRADGSGSNSWFICGVTGGKVGFNVIKSGGHQVNSVATVNDGNWHMVAGTYDLADQRIYVDGALDNTLAQAVGINTGNGIPLSVAAETPGTFGGTAVIDEFVFWSNRVLTDTEISTLWAAR